MLHPTGITPYTSYSISNSLYGVAGAFTFGRFVTNLYTGFDSSKSADNDNSNSAKSPVSQSVMFGRLSCAGGNVSYLHRHGSISANANYSAIQKQLKASADFQQMIGPVVAWAELCLGIIPASNTVAYSLSSVFGTRFPLLGCDIALCGLYSPEKHSVTMSANRLGPGRKTSITLAGMMAYNTIRASSSPGTAKLKIRAAVVSTPIEGWKFSTLLSAKLPSPRFELRQDISRELRHWLFTLRVDAVKGLQWAGLSYLECGYKHNLASRSDGVSRGDWATRGDGVSRGDGASRSDGVSRVDGGSRSDWAPQSLLGSVAVYCQCGLFFVDKWDDRIYVYRRDAPGAMSIPAMYGRGWYVACYTSLKFSHFAKLYLRVDYTSYPFARQGDTHTRPALNARLQIVLTF